MWQHSEVSCKHSEVSCKDSEVLWQHSERACVWQHSEVACMRLLASLKLVPLVRACTRLCMWSSEMRMCFNPQYLNPVLAGHALPPSMYLPGATVPSQRSRYLPCHTPWFLFSVDYESPRTAR